MQSLRSWERARARVVPEPSEQDDAQLVRASQRGNQEAFAPLVRKHQRRIFQLSLEMLKDEHDASECTQDVFVAAWQGLPGFRDEARFSTWLYRIAYQCCLRQLERRKQEHARHSARQTEQAPVGISKERFTAPLATRETNEGAPLTENEEVMHTSGPFPFQGRGQDSIPDNQETDGFSQHQQEWQEQQQGWVEQQRKALAQQEAWLEQRRGWLEQQQGWIEQRRVWMTPQGDKLTQQEAWLNQQQAWLDQQHTALVQQYSELVQQHQWMQQRRRWLDRQLRQLTQQESTLIQGDAAGERRSG